MIAMKAIHKFSLKRFLLCLALTALAFTVPLQEMRAAGKAEHVVIMVLLSLVATPTVYYLMLRLRTKPELQKLVRHE